MKKESLNEIVSKCKPTLIAIAVLLVISVSTFSYAFFTAGITNKNLSQTIVETGSMVVEYDDGNVIVTGTNMYPGDYVEKTFTVENKGNVTAYYNIYLNDVDNGFVDKDDLVYELITDDGRSVSQTVCPSFDTDIAKNIEIGVGQIHHYTLRITFLNDLENPQDDNHGVSFSAKLELEESGYVPSATEITYYNSSSTACASDQTIECALDELKDKLN